MLNFGALVQQSITKIEGREAIFVSHFSANFFH